MPDPAISDPSGTDGDLPQSPSVLRQLITVRRGEPEWSSAIRSGLAFAVPAAIALISGHEREMFLVIPGAFAILFGSGPYRRRARTVSAAAVVLVLSAGGAAAIGAALHSRNPALDPATWSWTAPMLMLCVYAAVACFFTTAIRLQAGSAVFVVMAAGGGMLTYDAEISVSQVMGWASVGGICAFGFAMLGWLFDPTGPQRRAVRTAASAIANYQDALEQGVPSVDARHDAILAYQHAWRDLTDAGRTDPDQATRPRRFLGLLSRIDHSIGSPMVSVNPSDGDHRDRRKSWSVNADYLAAFSVARAELRAAILGDLPTATNEEDETLSPRTGNAPSAKAHASGDGESDSVDFAMRVLPTLRMVDPSISYQLGAAAQRFSQPLLTSLRVLVAAVLAGTISLSLGLGRPDWAITTVVRLLGMGPSKRAGTVRGLHRAVGTAIGVPLFLLMWWAQHSAWLLIAVIGACQASIELLISKNYALAVIFVTPPRPHRRRLVL